VLAGDAGDTGPSGGEQRTGLLCLAVGEQAGGLGEVGGNRVEHLRDGDGVGDQDLRP
jgi:hypothetical protein